MSGRWPLGSCADGGGAGWAIGGVGGVEEGRLVVAPAAALRPSAEWKGL